MEWSWRTILILAGLLVIAAILFDGFRRMKQARAEALRLDIQPGTDDPEDDYNPELPGKARVVSTGEQKAMPLTERREPTLHIDQVNDDVNDNGAGNSAADLAFDKAETASPVVDKAEASEISADAEDKISSDTGEKISAKKDFYDEEPLVDTQPSPEPKITASPLIPKVKPVDLNEKVPVLLDVEELGDDQRFEESFEEGILSAPRVVDADAPEKPVESTLGKTTTAPLATDEESVDAELPVVEDPDTIDDPHLEAEAEPLPDEKPEAQLVNYAAPDAEVLANRPDASLVLVIHALARNPEGFRGKDLLWLFNSCDLRYGEKDIFHRFEEADGRGRIQFSVAQIQNPGTFDPATMADRTFRGLSFFMSLPGAKRPLEAYEAMSEMAMAVSRNLKAEVLDESHSAMTPQTMEHERQQILEYERQQRLAAKKQRL